MGLTSFYQQCIATYDSGCQICCPDWNRILNCQHTGVPCRR